MWRHPSHMYELSMLTVGLIEFAGPRRLPYRKASLRP
jgi:hypothetical protein